MSLDVTTCDGCGSELNREEANKVPRGQGTFDYFCNEDCEQEFRDRGETYLDVEEDGDE